MKKIILFIINFFGIISFSQALIINEIMYDPQGSDTSREWIEVYNDTGSSIDLSSWKFFESGTNHNLVASQGGSILSPNSYAVIADNTTKFLLDYPNFSGILFDSSFSLSNSGELIAIKDGGGSQIDSVNYSTALGGNDDGSTLSFINNTWVRGQATPVLENAASAISVIATSTSEITLPRAIMSAPGADITFILPENKIVVAGADANFSARAINSDKKQIDGLIYTWSFGDGGSKIGKSVAYNYSYPGFYIAYVEAQNEHISGNSRIRVSVVSPDIEVADSGNGDRGAFVDLKNNSNEDIDISHWILDVDGLRYYLPINTIISEGKVTRFSGRAVGFSSATGTVKLLFPDGNIVAVKNQIASSTSATVTISNLVFDNIQNKLDVIVNNNEKIFLKKEKVKLNREESKKDLVAMDGVNVHRQQSKDTATTSSSTVKIVTDKNTGIANWLRNLFNW